MKSRNIVSYVAKIMRSSVDRLTPEWNVCAIVERALTRRS